MPLRLGIPFTAVVLGVTTWLGFVLDVSLYWWVVAVFTLLSLREARAIELREYATSLALPSVGLGVVIAVGFPLTFPWFLRVRHRILTDRLARGSAQVGPLSYVFVGVIAVGSIWGAYRTFVVRSPGVLAEAQASATAVAEACEVALDLRLSAGRTGVTVFGPEVTTMQAWQRPFARRIAQVVAARDSAAGPGRSIVVAFATASRRGAVTSTRQHAEYTWSAGNLGVDAESPELNAADDALARALLPIVFAADTVALSRFAFSDSMQPVTKSLAPVLATLRRERVIGTPSDVRPMRCRTFHGEDGVRWASYVVTVGSRTTRVEIGLGGEGGRTVVRSINLWIHAVPVTDTL